MGASAEAALGQSLRPQDKRQVIQAFKFDHQAALGRAVWN